MGDGRRQLPVDRSWSMTIKEEIDGNVYALLTARVFAGLWPRNFNQGHFNQDHFDQHQVCQRKRHAGKQITRIAAPQWDRPLTRAARESSKPAAPPR